MACVRSACQVRSSCACRRRLPEAAPGGQDLALVTVDANNTQAAARIAARVLRADGWR